MQADIPLLPAHLQLRMSCEVGAVPNIARSVRDFLLRQGCSEKEVSDCELALVEACNNAALYSSPGSDQCEVIVEAISGVEEIELRVTDHTPGLIWPERATLPDSTSERGRGLFIIQALMDSTRYLRNPAGNTLVLHKRRSRQ